MKTYTGHTYSATHRDSALIIQDLLTRASYLMTAREFTVAALESATTMFAVDEIIDTLFSV